jgi:hypothetical protein
MSWTSVLVMLGAVVFFLACLIVFMLASAAREKKERGDR